MTFLQCAVTGRREGMSALSGIGRRDMKSNKIKLKGKIRTYFNLPLIMTIPLVWINIFIYSENIKDGAVFPDLSSFILE